MNALTPCDVGVTVPTQPKAPPSPSAAAFWLVSVDILDSSSLYIYPIWHAGFVG